MDQQPNQVSKDEKETMKVVKMPPLSDDEINAARRKLRDAFAEGTDDALFSAQELQEVALMERSLRVENELESDEPLEQGHWNTL